MVQSVTMLTWHSAHCRAGFQMLVALIVIAVSLSQMVPAPTWLGWYTLAFILLFDSAYAWSCEPLTPGTALPSSRMPTLKAPELQVSSLLSRGWCCARLRLPLSPLPRTWRISSVHNSMQCIICDMPGGPLGWLYPFEIQPLETRPAGGAVASLMNLLFSFVIGKSPALTPDLNLQRSGHICSSICLW